VPVAAGRGPRRRSHWPHVGRDERVVAQAQLGQLLNKPDDGRLHPAVRTVVAGGLFTHLGAGGMVHERGRWRATTLTSFTSFGGPSPGRQGGMLWLVVTHFYQGKAPHEEDPDERDLHRQRPTGYVEGTTVGEFTVKTGGRARFHLVGCPVPEGPVAATLEGDRNHWGGRQHGFGCLQPTGRVLAVLAREGVVGPTPAAQGGRCCGGRPAAPFQYGHLVVVGRPEPVGYAAGGVDVVGSAEGGGYGCWASSLSELGCSWPARSVATWLMVSAAWRARQPLAR
jgi:hypothetical protein